MIFRAVVGVVAACGFLLSSSCFVRSRTVGPVGHKTNKPVLSADKAELLRRIHAVSDPIQSFSMKAEMAPSVGEVFGGKVTDYPTIHGFILYAKPDQIRVLGLDPVVRSTVVDMVSTGNDFRVSIPVKSLFIEGKNDAPAVSKNKMENLRPVAFLNSLLIRAGNEGEMALLEDGTDESGAMYELLFIERMGDELRLARKVYFDRYTLEIARQRTYDAKSEVVSETKYDNWKDFGGVRFPASIDLIRPRDGYELHLDVTEFKLNPADVDASRFVMEVPEGAKVKTIN